ncbi:transposase, IS4 family [Ancylostoma ceylanicum]|uniref:Transposase, IS4 family n=1 Tax=Ancylostoma ceylanicum TaxID=53326 RepID=A0A0D6LKS4_9BILA|nr:transposase, IS4 family [Ancylostoma ceylanicum]
MSDAEDAAGRNLHKAISYVVVGINTIAESKKLFQFLRSNGYADVSLFHDFPEVRDPSEKTISTLDQTASASSAPLNELCKSFNGTIDELFSNQRSIRKNFVEKHRNNEFCCALCGQNRPIMDARLTSRKKDQRIVFLSCLLMENDINMDTANRLYKTSHTASKRICQSHYVKAEEVILEIYDVTRFFNECLARYYGINGWNDKDMWARQRKSRKRKQALFGLDGDIHERKRTVSAKNEESPATKNARESPLFMEPKDEPEEPVDEYEGISAAALLDQAMPSPSSAATCESSSDDKAENAERNSPVSTEDREKSRSPDEVKDDVKASTSAAVNPPRIIRNPPIYVNTVADRKFRQRFRMSRSTFKILCDALDPFLEKHAENKTKSYTAIKVGTALEVLAGNAHAMKGLHLMGSSVTEIFGDVLDALLKWSGSVIQWPGQEERAEIGERFFKMTGLTDIVGCLDGTIIGAQHPPDEQQSPDEPSKGPRSLNVAVIADDKQQFRWVLAKYLGDVEDEEVFKRSLLCQQLKNGAKKGRLIGDEAYKREPFLLTPNSAKRFRKETHQAYNETLYKAHKTVQEAIASWKRQFPILTSDIISPKVARIIVGSAAVYNLTRFQGEPPFTYEEEAEEVYQRCSAFRFMKMVESTY